MIDPQAIEEARRAAMQRDEQARRNGGDPRGDPRADPRADPRMHGPLKGNPPPQNMPGPEPRRDVPPPQAAPGAEPRRDAPAQKREEPHREEAKSQVTTRPVKGERQISRSRHVYRTRVRGFLTKAFGTACTINSVMTTIYCMVKLESLWRGDPELWSYWSVGIGAILGVVLFLAQLAYSDWDSPGVFIAYFVVLGLDAFMTSLPWYREILLPLFGNTMKNPQAAVLPALAISGVWAMLSAYMSEYTYLGARARSLLDRIKGRG